MLTQQRKIATLLRGEVEPQYTSEGEWTMEEQEVDGYTLWLGESSSPFYAILPEKGHHRC